MKFATLFVLTLAALSSSMARPSNLPKGRAISMMKSGGSSIWKDCSSSSDMSTINSVSFSPDPPKKGQPLTVHANFTLKEKIEGGSVSIDATYDGFIPFKKTFDLCTLAKDAGFSCPISSSVTSATVTEDVPNIGGHIKGTVKASDQNGKEIMCIEVDFQL